MTQANLHRRIGYLWWAYFVLFILISIETMARTQVVGDLYSGLDKNNDRIAAVDRDNQKLHSEILVLKANTATKSQNKRKWWPWSK